MQLIFAILIGKLILKLTRILKTGGGSAAPGLYALKIEPNLVRKLTAQIPQNIVITGTNGKTTTARILTHLVENQGLQGLKVIRNSTGSNLHRGIASSLIEKADLFGRIKGVDLGIWELDEAAFNHTIFDLKPQIIVFLNAFRDQLDRYGEVDTVTRKWRNTLEMIDWKPKVILNGGDPNTASLGDIRDLDFSVFKIKNHRMWRERDLEIKDLRPDFEAKVIENNGLRGSKVELKLGKNKISVEFSVPGIYHVYDLLAALSVFYHLNLKFENLDKTLKNFKPAFGRVEKVQISKKDAYIFLIKNPAGANYVFETLAPELKQDDVILAALNDNFADGTDVSWIWDASFEKIVSNTHGKVICSGKRAHDLALRLKYAGFEPKNIDIVTQLGNALEKAKKTKGRVFILPTYTALLELQKILAKSGIKEEYWKS